MRLCTIYFNPVESARIKSTPELGPYIPNLTSINVSSLEKIQAAYELGKRNVLIGLTAMGRAPSRMIKYLTLTLTKTLDDGETRTSQLSFVELAGLERQNKIGHSGHSLKEATKIGLSLRAFNQVIFVLAENATSISKGATRVKHAPYRDSNVTRLLQPALSGNGNLSFIATCRCEDSHYRETISTLRVASRMFAIRGSQSNAIDISPMINSTEPSIKSSPDTSSVVIAESATADCLSNEKHSSEEEVVEPVKITIDTVNRSENNMTVDLAAASVTITTPTVAGSQVNVL
jgi:hypothetical protein